MKNSFIIIFLTSLLLFNAVNANNNIVFVDMENIMATSKPGLHILKQLGDLKNENLKNFKKKETILKDNEKKIIKQKNIISTEDFELKVNNLKKDIKEYNEYRNEKIKTFKQIKANNTNKLLSLINPILIQYTKDKSISMVLQKKNIIISQVEFDITKKIIELVDKNIKEFKIK